MHTSRYHKFLRISMLVMTLLLIFDSGVLFPITRQFSGLTISYLASVGSGVFASVPPNEINSLSAQISARERELDARESQLNEREIATRPYTRSETSYSTYIMSALLFIIMVLLSINYVMDWTRARRYAFEQSIVANH